MAHVSDIQEDSGAIFDTTGTYRYTLWRRWSLDYPQVAFMMLNPSTADSQRNDATIRRCINFARLWGFGALEVVNLFAYKATSPRELLNVENPVGLENDRYLLRALERSACLVVAWGTHGTLLWRDREVLKLLTCYPTTTLKCLGLTKEGHPRHPLYLGSRTQLMTFPFVGRGQAASAPTIETGLESRRGRFIVPTPDLSGLRDGPINREWAR